MTGRRRAPVARETSDVRRGKGLVVASLLAFAAVVAASAVSGGTRALVSPGPLALPHGSPEIACGVCHVAGEARARCDGCHGPQRSARRGHERLRAAGALACGDCHALHRSEQGLAFFRDGRVVHYGSGYERELSDPESRFRPTRTTYVPLIGVEACTLCHDASDATDPAAICFRPGASDGTQFALCFDEHGGESGARGRNEPGRAAAIEAARALSIGLSAGPGGSGAALAPVLFGLSAALLALGLRRLAPAQRLANLRKRRARAAAPLAPFPGGRRLPVIDAARCLGCSACVDACPYDVLELESYVAKVVRPEACCGLVACQDSCPNGSLVVQAADQARPGPALSEGLELADNPGVHLAGDVTGLPLIRIAVEQGAEAARAVARRLPKLRSAAPSGLDADVLVIGAGPAGLSAALELHKRGLRVITLEQGKIAESIHSFPRGKLILDRPIAAGGGLPLWLGECTKEELVARWSRSVRRARLDLREGARVTGIRRTSPLDRDPEFEVSAETGAGLLLRLRARRVVLAVGRRGTPRKLAVEIPSSMQGRVHYALRDAKSFAGKRSVIIGLGDSAMEAAQALVQQPGARVTMVYRGSDFRRGRARNVDVVRRLAAEGKLELIFDGEVAGLGDGRAQLRTRRGPLTLACDALFVMIGSLPGEPLLDALLRRRLAPGSEP